MNEKTSTLAVHAACVALIAACFALAYTVLKPYPDAAGALVIAAWWLWGKLGFEPANPVLARILQRLGPDAVAKLSARPPAPTWESIKIDLNNPDAVIKPVSTLTEQEFQKLAVAPKEPPP